MSHSVKCGIYQILCRPTGKSYIGSSKGIYGRWRQHRLLLRRGDNGCRILQLAWNKHGEEAFYFSVLEECDFSLLTEREQYYVDLLQPEYNIVKTLKGTRLEITHCPRGHEYTEKNAYIDANGSRICRACNANRVAARNAAASPEEREKRYAYNKESYYANRAARRAQQSEYVLAHKAEKAEYDRKRRALATHRQRERLRNHTPEEHAAYLEKKRRGYHSRKIRNAAQIPLALVPG